MQQHNKCNTCKHKCVQTNEQKSTKCKNHNILEILIVFHNLLFNVFLPIRATVPEAVLPNWQSRWPSFWLLLESLYKDSSYLQVFFIVVVDDGQEDGHEDVGVDEDIQDEEDGEEEAGIVRRHPAKEKQKTKGAGHRYTNKCFWRVTSFFFSVDASSSSDCRYMDVVWWIHKTVTLITKQKRMKCS